MSISRPLLPAFIQTFLLLHWRIHIRITVLSKFKADPHKNPIPKLSTLIGHWNKKWTIARILKRDKTISIVIKVFLLSKCLRYFKYYIQLYDLYWMILKCQRKRDLVGFVVDRIFVAFCYITCRFCLHLTLNIFINICISSRMGQKNFFTSIKKHF